MGDYRVKTAPEHAEDNRKCGDMRLRRPIGASRKGDGMLHQVDIVTEPETEDRRPWGYFEVLSDCPDHKVKRIVVDPCQRLSYQRHQHRYEHWYVVSGEAVVTRDGEEIRVAAGEAIDIPRTAWHRVRNPGDEPLVFIEVQTGDYFGEDDIERQEDDYGRS